MSYILFGLYGDFFFVHKKGQNLPRCGQSWNRSPNARPESILDLGVVVCSGLIISGDNSGSCTRLAHPGQ